MHASTTIALLGTALALVACSTTLRTTEVESFEPQIFGDGTKTFRYTVEDHGSAKTQTYIEFTDQRVEDLDQNDPLREADEREQQRREQRFRQLLSQKLKATGFCREGFVELDSDLGYRRSTLHGECRDAASDEDRQRFPGGS